ncbi:uncharacterized protein LOC141587978 [Silene latifolia]|uniref:uncharacterized protein LOC141587978 n=1 Tax=Silene latifolia TaxID=37657 RepID=UPI003D77851D
MEVLSRLLRQLPTFPGFSYHPKCVKVNLTHLIFADDLLVFTRGDLPSIQAVDKSLLNFASYSGLRVNPMKSNLYFGGVSPSLKQLILATTGYVEGDFPVRYLGIPLFGARLTQRMFIPLLDKIRSKITHWANNFLSYAGKISLINSVIFGIQNFWGASILLLKGIAKKIHKMCKDFFWGVAAGERRMVFKGWDSLCRPRKEGGVDIKEILSWNKAQMMGWIRKLESDSPNVWAKWVKAYILKGANFWSFQLTAAHSWFWGNIIECRDCLLMHTDGLPQAQLLLAQPNFKALIYDCLRNKGPVLSTHRILDETLNFPKHVIIGLLAIQNKLPTVDNLCTRGLVLVNRCVLCESHSETADHLFFYCSFSATVWATAAQWLKITPSLRLHQILRWYKLYNRGKGWIKRLRRCLLLCVIYLLWNERNRRLFQGIHSTPFAVVKRAQFLVLTRLSTDALAFAKYLTSPC